jgi:hypothetical protein
VVVVRKKLDVGRQQYHDRLDVRRSGSSQEDRRQRRKRRLHGLRCDYDHQLSAAIGRDEEVRARSARSRSEGAGEEVKTRFICDTETQTAVIDAREVRTVTTYDTWRREVERTGGSPVKLYDL